jgi:NTP pyrophosphohydrolases including oxidative damage repair enzymes
MTPIDALRRLVGLFRAPARRRRGRQVAAVALRDGETGPEILLVTSRRRSRWIVPKGWIEDGEDGVEAARREAWEEAGIRTKSPPEGPVGSYTYIKTYAKRPDVECEVRIYLLRNVREKSSWPESKKRERRWVTVDDALRMLDEPALRDALRAALSSHGAA